MGFIVIEGLDGAGKSTQLSMLREHVLSKGVQHESLHFPRTDSPYFGDLIARFLRGEFGGIDQVDPYLVAMLYAGDRKGASSLIAGWLGQGRVVLLDRYVYSNIAFQCAKLQDPEKSNKLRDWIFKLEFEYFGIPKPDLNIFLDVPFKFTESSLTKQRAGADRSYLGNAKDIHEEDLSFQDKVRKVYLQQQDVDPRFKVISCASADGGMDTPKAIHAKILNLVDGIV